MSDNPLTRLPSEPRLAGPPASEALAAEGRTAFERLAGALGEAGLAVPEGAAARRLEHALCCSAYLAKTLLVHPGWVGTVCDENALETPFDPARFDDIRAELEATDVETGTEAFMALLRRLRHREMVRIALRDLYGWAPLAETMAALSALADFCLAQAHARAWAVQRARHGEPVGEDSGEVQSLVVLALGKLGGCELNYSSDIDLIFAYPEAGQTRATNTVQRTIDNHRFFIGQAQLLIKYLNETTPEGFVFRVDARLRPFGDAGALAVSFDFMESYYQHQGREWERYAMIKARPVCGEPAHAEALTSLLRPFVYRRYLDYGAFSSLRDMKALVAREVARKGMKDDVKLGAGGIREIEFVGQAFQLIRGGREPALRSRSIAQVLECLDERGLLEAGAASRLLEAYRFLRDTENRLQMTGDRQEHRLPRREPDRARLAYAMGFGDWKTFIAALDEHRDAVNHCFEGVFFGAEADPGQAEDPVALSMQALVGGQLSDRDALELFGELEFADPEAALEAFRTFFRTHSVRHMTAMARERLARLLPAVFEALKHSYNPVQTLQRVLGLFQAVVQRPVYLALLLEYPEATRQLIKLCGASGWIAEYLTGQPILLDTLMDPRLLYQLPSKDELSAQLRRLIQAQSAEEPEQQLNALRHFKHEQVLRVAAVDVNEHLPLMKVSDQLTWLAEAVLTEVHGLVRGELAAKYGSPRCSDGGAEREPELAVIGYGKLGGIELGYGSDLDLVFVHDSAGRLQQTAGPREVDNITYFVRLAQRIIHWLTTPTVGGVLYDTDLRLRPDGASGLLVSSLEAFEQYQRERAWVWEHQALVRARVIVGGEDIRRRFAGIRHQILSRPRDVAELKNSVREMRERMRREVAKSRGSEFDLKHDRGGLGDIEFLVQFGVLAWSHAHPELTHYTDNIRILEQFGRLELLPAGEARALTDAYRHLRGLIHRRALEGAASVVDEMAASTGHIDCVASVWRRVMEDG